jgi:hypothetical protein
MRLGYALEGLGHLEEARDAYQQALDIRQALNQAHLTTDLMAGLARVSLAQGNLLQAKSQVEEILHYLDTGTLDGADRPFCIYLTVCHVLRASDDPRAGDVLDTAHCLLQQWAAQIDDPELRRSFLENVADHREIATEWAARERASRT